MNSEDSSSDLSLHSSLRAQILEHLFIGEVLQTMWQMGYSDMEVLRGEVDTGGANGVE